jgi:hypothetical protein
MVVVPRANVTLDPHAEPTVTFARLARVNVTLSWRRASSATLARI